MNKKFYYFLAVVIYFLSGIYITFPLILHMGSLTTGLSDELLISWIQTTVIRNLFTNPLHLFSGNIFYPYRDVLAYSDLHLVSALMSSIPTFMTGQAITAINVTLLSSIILLGFSAFALSYYFTKDFSLSILSGFLIQFSPTTLDKNTHVQILAVEWVLFAILFLFMFFQTRRFTYFVVSVIFFLTQTLNSFLPGYFIILSYCVIIFVFLKKNKKKFSYYFHKEHILTFLIAISIIALFTIPYFTVSRQFASVRDIREVIHLSLQPEDLYFPNDLTRLQPLLLSLSSSSRFPRNAEFKVGYLGGIFSILSLLTIVYVLKYRKNLPPELLSLFLIGISGFVLSFGPALHLGRRTIHFPTIIPLPYALLYYIVPGFQGIRAAYRWEMLYVLSFAVCSILVLHSFMKRFSFAKRVTCIIILSILVLGEYRYPMHFSPVTQTTSFPQVYSYVRALPADARIVEMPIYNWNMSPYSIIELRRVYFSTYHRKAMINGASGFSPPPWQQLATTLLETFPSQQSLATLKGLEIQYVIVHKDEYDRMSNDKYLVGNIRIENGNAIVNELRKRKNVRLVRQLGNDIVFSLL